MTPTVPALGGPARPARALVTGGTGFVGAHLVARLVAEGWTVVATARPGSAPSRLEALGLCASAKDSRNGTIEVAPVDLADRTAVTELARRAQPDVVFHLVASRVAGEAEERARTAAVNTMSGHWLVDGLDRRCRLVIRLGSSTEYAQLDGPIAEDAPLRPRGFFGATKAAGSLLLASTAAERGLATVILRAFQVYGPLDHPGRFVPTVLRAARSGACLPLTGPGRRRDWVYVDDVVDACLRAATVHLTPGQVLNIGTGRQVANEELVAVARRVTGRPIRSVEHGHPGRAWDTGSWVSDPSLAAELLGWRALVGLEDGLARCWAAMADADSEPPRTR